MNQEIYEDRYKPTVPKVIDYGCIAVAILSFFYLAYKFQCVFWYPLLLLLVPFVLSRFPGRIYCDGETVAIQDPYHGTKRIPIEAITGLEIKVYAHQEGIPMVMTVHHYIYVMRIRTPPENLHLQAGREKGCGPQGYCLYEAQAVYRGGPVY